MAITLCLLVSVVLGSVVGARALDGVDGVAVEAAVGVAGLAIGTGRALTGSSELPFNR